VNTSAAADAAGHAAALRTSDAAAAGTAAAAAVLRMAAEGEKHVVVLRQTASVRPEAAAAGPSLAVLLAAGTVRALVPAGTRLAAAAGYQGSQLAAAHHPRHPGHSASHRPAAETGAGLVHCRIVADIIDDVLRVWLSDRRAARCWRQSIHSGHTFPLTQAQLVAIHVSDHYQVDHSVSRKRKVHSIATGRRASLSGRAASESPTWPGGLLVSVKAASHATKPSSPADAAARSVGASFIAKAAGRCSHPQKVVL
jgi:hypothetical protein